MSNIGNFVQCRFVTPLAIGATEMTLYAADAPYNLPPAGGGLLVLVDSPGNPSFIEVVSYASRTGLNLSGVVRGLEGTTARAWSGFAYCFQSMLSADYAADMNSKENAIAAGTAAQMWLGNKTWASVLNQVQGTLLTGLNLTVGTAVAAGDNVLAAFGKLQKQITNAATNLASNVRATVLTGYIVGSDVAVANTDNMLVAIQKLQGQVSARAASSHTHSYAPLTGEGTSGSWPISITGNAGSLPGFAPGGLQEIGRYLDFHNTANGYDYDVRIEAVANGGAGLGKLSIAAAGGISMNGNISLVRGTEAIAIGLGSANGWVVGTSSDIQLGKYGLALNFNLTSGDVVCPANISGYSDIRLKTDIELIPDALFKIEQLRGVTFTRTDSGARQVGVIAQEVQKVLPEAVVTANDEMQTLSVAYGNMVGLLIEGIKELNQTVIGLQAEVKALKEGA